MTSLIDAIKQKYDDDPEDEERHESGGIIFYVPKTGRRKRLPSILILDDCNVECVGDLHEMQRQCEGVRELDLSRNKITDWNEVFQIFDQLASLSFVNLSFNNLSGYIESSASFHLPHMNKLVLNETQICWDMVYQLLQSMPSLEELHLGLNNYTTVPHNGQQYPTVKTLHFNGNFIDWKGVCKLDQMFPAMEWLVVMKCKICDLVPPDDCDKDREIFANLRLINLNYNDINDWTEVDRLRHMKELQELRLMTCPLFEEYTEHERRQLCIARLPNLSRLNGCLIGTTEREDAERAFIRLFMDKPESEQPERYHELVAVYGKLDPLADVDFRPKTEVYVSITYKSQKWQKNISVNQSVSQLRKYLSTLTDLPVARMRLYYVDHFTEFGPEEMKFPAKKLYSYKIDNGDEFIVDEKY